MPFSDQLENLLPLYLSHSQKMDLRMALVQFKDPKKGVNYSNFYHLNPDKEFLQSDLVSEIRCPHWDSSKFIESYPDAVILSHGCDITKSNSRALNSKQCVFAPVLKLSDYIDELKLSNWADQRITTHVESIKCQEISNIFYMPAKSGIDFMVLFDKSFWFPTEELNALLPDIANNRMASLTNFGHYLFVFKLSFHFCRLPEDNERL